jgi:uncharacterized protein (UPF0261 family)
MRTSVRESQRLGRLVALKLNKARGPVAVLLPTRGFSAYDRRGKPFFYPRADAAFIRVLRQYLAPAVEVREFNCHINDDEFGRAAAWKLLELLRGAPPAGPARGGKT